MKKILLVVSIVALVSACGLTTYKSPEDGQPYALVKLKYSFDEIMPQAELGTRLGIKPGDKRGIYKSAFDTTYGFVNTSNITSTPLEAIKVHPDQNIDLKMAVYFYWYTTYTYTTYINGVPQTNTTQQYNEVRCDAFMNFTPENGKVYLIDYTQIDLKKQCDAIVYEQVPVADGKFKMKQIAKSEPPKQEAQEESEE